VLTACGNSQKKVEIVYQDQTLVVLNKPGGLVVLKGHTVREETLQDWVENNLGIDIANRAGIVHRLDKPTWGLILVARNQFAFDDLQQQFKERRIKKTYWALVRGKPPIEGEIVAPIGRSPGRRLRFAVVPGGKAAETSYRVMKEVVIGSEEYSLLEVRPKTGRTHQIRVHFQYLGHPIFGDRVYGGKRERERPLFLVAKEISFVHPETKKGVNFGIDLPKELRSLLTNSS